MDHKDLMIHRDKQKLSDKVKTTNLRELLKKIRLPWCLLEISKSLLPCLVGVLVGFLVALIVLYFLR